MAYKEYSPSSLAHVDVDALERLVTMPRRADDGLRRLLLRQTAWPVATVHRDGTVCGFLMPVALEDFRSTLRLPTGYRRQLLTMEFLLNPPEYMVNVDLRVSEHSRLVLLRELATLLAGLHRHEIVVGDLSPKNVLVGLRTLRCYLLDCDSLRVGGHSVLPPIETPDWQLPDGEELATPAGDRFKFGLLAIRLLLSDQSANDPRLLRGAQPALAKLAARSRAPSAARPTWSEWIDALDAAIPIASVSVSATSPGAPAGVPQRITQSADTRTPPSTPLHRREHALRALVVAVGFAVLIGVSSSQVGDSGADRAPVLVVPESPQAPSAEGRERTSVGVVDIITASSDPHVLPVAELLDAYFQGINRRDWGTVLRLYDPAGVLDTANPEHRASFINDMETTTDYDISLLEVRTNDGHVLARVTFHSEQASGYGPAGHADQVCTLWDVTYVLAPHRDGYRILGSDSSLAEPC
jgi:hypothetical protein